MFYPAPESSDPHTLSEPARDGRDRPHTGFTPLRPDPGALLAAAGLSSRVIREIVGNPPGVGADG